MNLRKLGRWAEFFRVLIFALMLHCFATANESHLTIWGQAWWLFSRRQLNCYWDAILLHTVLVLKRWSDRSFELVRSATWVSCKVHIYQVDFQQHPAGERRCQTKCCFCSGCSGCSCVQFLYGTCMDLLPFGTEHLNVWSSVLFWLDCGWLQISLSCRLCEAQGVVLSFIDVVQFAIPPVDLDWYSMHSATLSRSMIPFSQVLSGPILEC